MKNMILLSAFIFTFSLNSFAGFTGANSGSGSPGENKFRAGLLLGNVALSSEPNNEGKNSLGFGAVLGYSLADELALELSYVGAKHGDLKQQDYSLGASYYFSNYEPFYFHLTGGVSFTNGELDLPAGNLNDTAFGLFAGVGADIFTKRALIIGLQTRYYKMYGSDKSLPGSSVGYQVVNDFYTIMVRLMFQF